MEFDNDDNNKTDSIRIKVKMQGNSATMSSCDFFIFFQFTFSVLFELKKYSNFLKGNHATHYARCYSL